jgi:tripartite-type tricarboxylate transporter receptor subunit TctC
MRFPRRAFLRLTGMAIVVPAFPRLARAQLYPSRPITMIVPFPPGGPTDVVGRVLAERMGGSLGQAIIVENIAGAEGSIGLGRVARARADGYTIDLGSNSAHVLNGALLSLQYDLLNDFAPILPLVTSPYILFGRKTMPAANLKELIGWLKRNGDKASVGVGGGGPRVVSAFFQRETGTQFALVPYRGTAPRVQDLLAGQIDLSFGEADQLGLVRAGSIKAYAVTSETRLARARDIPTFGEMGFPTLSFFQWYGLFAPKGTPREIIGKLNAAAIEALADATVRSRLVELGFEIFPSERQTPEALGALRNADAKKWWPIVKELGIRAE